MPVCWNFTHNNYHLFHQHADILVWLIASGDVTVLCGLLRTERERSKRGDRFDAGILLLWLWASLGHWFALTLKKTEPHAPIWLTGTHGNLHRTVTTLPTGLTDRGYGATDRQRCETRGKRSNRQNAEKTAHLKQSDDCHAIMTSPEKFKCFADAFAILNTRMLVGNLKFTNIPVIPSEYEK